MLGRLFEDYAGIRADYGDDDELLPPIDNPEDLQQAIGFGAIYVLLAHRDDVAYVGFERYCRWDEEHGIGIMMHKDRLVHWGGADADPHKKDRHGKDSFEVFVHRDKEITNELQSYFKAVVVRNYKNQ
jgi:hypothetical protein